MKLKLYFFAIISTLSQLCFAQSPNWNWGAGGGGANLDRGWACATDSIGNVYIGGDFASPTINFGSVVLSSTAGTDGFFAKYSPNGSLVWAKKIGGIGSDGIYSITVSNKGNICVLGSFNSPSISYGGHTITNSGGGANNYFLFKLDSSGNVIWSRGGGPAYGSSVVIDPKENVYLTGSYYSTTINFDTIVLTTLGNSDIFLAKFDTLGNAVWAATAGGTSSDGTYSLALDSNGNSYITGSFYSPAIVFDSITLINLGTSSSCDFFVAKYDTSGILMWAKGGGGTGGGDDIGKSIAVDSHGNSYISGSFRSNPCIVDTINLPNSGQKDIFLIKYDTSGNLIWAKREGDNGDDESNCVITDKFDNVFIAGYFTGNPVIGSYPLVNANGGSGDVFVIKYDSLGTVIWAKSAGGYYYDVPKAMAINASGMLCISGFYSSTVSYGPSTITNSGSYDIFAAQMNTLQTSGLTKGFEITHAPFLFPNPASEFSTIVGDEKINRIEITNTLGVVIQKLQPNENSAILRLKEEGVYFVRCTSDKRTTTQKLIIRK